MTAGNFAQWQPAYQAAGICTFPVVIDGARKRPAVRGFLKIGSEYSRKLAAQFPNSQAFGFACGQRSHLSVLDVDSTDERELADALDRHGQTPVVIRTGGGKFHAWYRHNGERRMIRPERSRPVDILGGGYAIAPPSRGAVAEYQFLTGSLNDIGSLPVMRNVPAPVRRSAAEIAPTASLDGERNNALFRYCLSAARHCDDLTALLDVARTRNADFMPPIEDDSEVVKTARSAWRYEQEGRNYSSGSVIPVRHDEVDGLLAAAPDAFLLLTLLRRHHWDRDFIVANEMARSMPPGGWRRERFAAARLALEQAGKIQIVRFASRTRGPTLYRWPDPLQSKGAQK